MQLINVSFKNFMGAPRPDKITYEQDHLPSLHEAARVSDGHGEWDCEVCTTGLMDHPSDYAYVVTYEVQPPSL